MRLFGPVLFYDLLRMARRGRYILLRCLYVTLLLALLWWLYHLHFGQRPVLPYRTFPGEPGARTSLEASAQQLARFAEQFFIAFMAVQFLLILVMTPASTAGAIAEEKQRKTLEYILATDLSNREIVLGKLLSRLGNMTLFLLAGLPVISLMLFLGGIDPLLLWAGFGATVLTMLSIASLSILNSVYAKRPRDAIVRTYLMIAGYPAFWAILLMLRELFSLEPPAPKPVLLFMDGLMDVYNSGNIFWALYLLVRQVNTAGTMGTLPFWLFVKFAGFHLLVSALCILLAIRRVRAVYVRQAFGGSRKSAKKEELARRAERKARSGEVVGQDFNPDVPEPVLLEAVADSAGRSRLPSGASGEGQVLPGKRDIPKRRVRPRPPVDDRPMIWKERYIERGFRLGMLGEGAFALLGLVCLFPGLLAFGLVVLDTFSGGGGVQQFQQGMKDYVRFMGTAIACILLLAIGIRAAGSIAGERDRQTLDSLMGSLLSNREVLWGKWVGSVLAPRWVYAMLGLVLFMAAITLSLHWSSFLLLMMALAAFVTFTASLGLALAAASKSGLRAVSAFAFIFLLCCAGPFLAVSTLSSSAETRQVLHGFSPVFVLQRLAYHGSDLRPPEMRPYGSFSRYDAERSEWASRVVLEITSCAVGLACYALAALLLWFRAERKFRQTCGRVLPRPERQRIPPRSQMAKPTERIAERERVGGVGA